MPTPKLEWDFSTANYAGGTSVTDISGNGNDGQFNASPLSWDTTIGWIELSSIQEVRVPNGFYPNNLPVGTAAKSMVYWGTISSYDHTVLSFGGNTVAGSRIDFGYSFSSGTFGIEFSGTGLNSVGAVFLNLFISFITLTGNLIDLEFSCKDCNIDCLTHHIA
jgi:hypothetical protein